MDNAIWIVTIIAHVAILAIITYKMIDLPWFTLTILAGLIESGFLFLVHQHGSWIDYYYAYYACDILNIALYCLTIRECRKRMRFELISFSMMVYLVPKFSSYATMAFGKADAAILIHGLLRPLNFGCLLCWIAVVAMYSEVALHPNQGDFMDTAEQIPVTEDECEEKPAEPVHTEHPERDPGAPPPTR